MVKARKTYSGQLFNVVVTGPKRRKSNFLWELGKWRISEERDMTNQLVANVRLRCVQRSRGMTDVLGRMEHSERQPCQKVSRRQQASHWPESEPCRVYRERERKRSIQNGEFSLKKNYLTFQECRYILQLWNVVDGVATVFLQQGQDTVELSASMGLEQGLEVAIDRPPSGSFFLSVFHPRNLFSTARKQCLFCNSSIFPKRLQFPRKKSLSLFNFWQLCNVCRCI